MSLIEGDVYFPLFATGELPIDFSAAGLVPDSPGKFPQFTARRASFALSNSQTVPGNINLQNLGPLDEPLFSLFMNGPEKMDLAGGFVKGLQIPEELLLQSSMVPEARKPAEIMGMGMDGRQFVQMGLMPEPMVNGEFNAMVPQMPAKPTQNAVEDNSKSANARKRKFIQNPVKCDPQGVPSADGQSLSPEEERNMKRQRRLVKNREAAQLFRQRQKAYIQDLEKKVADLSATNNDFRARVELLNSENKLIKEQLLYLRNFITQAVSFSFPKSPNGEDGTPSPTSLLGPLPPGLTLPPEILGAMGNMPNMALGLMGALGSAGAIPGLPPMPNFADMLSNGAIQAMQGANSASRPPQSPAQAPIVISPSGKPVNISALSPVAVPSSIPIVPSVALIPPPNKPLNNSQNNANAVVPTFVCGPSSEVPESMDAKVKVEKHST